MKKALLLSALLSLLAGCSSRSELESASNFAVEPQISSYSWQVGDYTTITEKGGNTAKYSFNGREWRLVGDTPKGQYTIRYKNYSATPSRCEVVVELTNIALGDVSFGEFDEVTNEIDELF